MDKRAGRSMASFVGNRAGSAFDKVRQSQKRTVPIEVETTGHSGHSRQSLYVAYYPSVARWILRPARADQPCDRNTLLLSVCHDRQP
jgi:hypothetical protein